MVGNKNVFSLCGDLNASDHSPGAPDSYLHVAGGIAVTNGSHRCVASSILALLRLTALLPDYEREHREARLDFLKPHITALNYLAFSAGSYSRIECIGAVAGFEV